MNYLHQFLRIILFSFLGEGLHILLPWPIPASIYGMVLLFLALALKWIKIDQIRESGQLLVNIMAVLFVCPAVGLLKCWDIVQDKLLPVCVIVLVSLVLTFGVSGRITQWLIQRKGDEKNG